MSVKEKVVGFFKKKEKPKAKKPLCKQFCSLF